MTTHLAQHEMGRALKRGRQARFVALPHVVLESPDYLGLRSSAKALLVDLAFQYNGRNNGDLTSAFGYMKKRGWCSKQTIASALRELVAAGLVVKTRQGKFQNPHACCDLYALTWQPINECLGKNLEVSATTTPPRKFSLEASRTPGPEIGPSSAQKSGRTRMRDARGRYVAS